MEGQKFYVARTEPMCRRAADEGCEGKLADWGRTPRATECGL